jgi:TonB family protein
MKLSVAAALPCLALLCACNMNAQERLLPNSHRFSPNLPIPTKYVHINDPTYCPNYVGEAHVDIAYTLEPDGSVSNVRRLDEKPAGCGFAAEAIYAFRKWRFEPEIQNGVAVRVDRTYSFAWTFDKLK